VQDQASVPVENATVKAIVHLSNNTNQEYTFTTNARGIGQVSFNFSDQKPGELISIDITVDYQGLTGATTTSYRIWF
jgi:hypothetical protein